MKAAPVLAALSQRGARQTLVHTGQHYDANMSDVILQELGVPAPDINLGVGSASHGVQTAQVIVGVEKCLQELSPDRLIVYGDVNSTMAAALAAVKVGVPVAHVEAGLRSGDRSMPEEINRIVTDRLAATLFTPSADADDNLLAEGCDPASIKLVGNVMIDTLVRLLPSADGLALLPAEGGRPGKRDDFALVTLHRPTNVDDPAMLNLLLDTLVGIAEDIPVVIPMHPRTRSRLGERSLDVRGLTVLQPISYLQFLGLERRATVVITDSGGIQEETTYLGVPCLTVRDTTERPITVTQGTNTVVGRDMALLKIEVERILNGQGKRGTIPPLWDGRSAERIADHLIEGA
jgi:UDP-N-acetylglucosamine 2-epimerase (non-hydrolysing)